MSQFDDGRRSATESSKPVSEVLLRIQALGYTLGSQELVAWATMELQGYPSASTVPDYRKTRDELAVFASLTNGVRNDTVPVPLDVFPKEQLNRIVHPSILDSAPALESMAVRSATESLQLPLSEGYRRYVERLFPGFTCIRVYRPFSAGSIHSILSAIRARVIQYLHEVSQQFPDLGGDGANIQQADPQVLRNLAQVVIYNNQGQVQFGNGSQKTLFHQVLVPGDFSGLVSALRQEGIDENDLQELEAEIQGGATRESVEDESSGVRRWAGRVAEKLTKGAGGLARKATEEAILLSVRYYFGDLTGADKP